MVLANKKKFFIIAGLTVLPLVMAEVALISSRASIKPSKASAYSYPLDNTNSPELTDGEGTWTDESRNVTWEYHNASDNPNGHITLNHQGYFGVSSTTTNGITGIESVTASFTKGTNGELWLLSSIDGTNWNEVGQLESSTQFSSILLNNWRYVRFYCYDADSTPISISSVSIGYSCEGTSTLEDVDFAKVTNIETVSGVSYTRETETLSPNSHGEGEAIRFVKTAAAGAKTYTDFDLGDTYHLSDLKTAKIEFDYYHKDNTTNYKPTIWLLKDGTTLGFEEQQKDSKSNYKVTDIDDDWWHIEFYIFSTVPYLSGYKTENKPVPLYTEINGFRVGNGTSIIDNLRFSSTPSDLGVFNNSLSFSRSSNKPFWFKICWSGELHSATYAFTFADPENPIAEQVPTSDPNLCNESPFYIKAAGTGTGTFTVTATVIVGYDRQIKTISRDIKLT